MDLLPPAAVRILEDARHSYVIEDRAPVERILEVPQALTGDNAGNVILVRQQDRLRRRDAELRDEERAEILVVGRPHEWIVDDGLPLEHGLLEVRAVHRDLVRDTVGEDVVWS